MRTQKLYTTRLRKPFQHPMHVELADTVGAGRLELLPDAVLPEQFYGPLRGASRAQSEVALMRAVLDDAINCYQKQFVASARREQRLAREAEAWFFDNDERWPFSFVNVCRALDLEPEYLRRGLKRWYQRPPAKPQRGQRRTIPPRRILRIAA
jgi:hypothetical protein